MLLCLLPSWCTLQLIVQCLLSRHHISIYTAFVTHLLVLVYLLLIFIQLWTTDMCIFLCIHSSSQSVCTYIVCLCLHVSVWGWRWHPASRGARTLSCSVYKSSRGTAAGAAAAHHFTRRHWPWWTSRLWRICPPCTSVTTCITCRSMLIIVIIIVW